MIAFLLDTSTCVDLIRGKSAGVTSHLTVRAPGEVGISTITLAELEYGVARSADPARNGGALIRFCAQLAILPFDEVASRSYGWLRRDLESVGTPIGPLDTLIAGHALALGCTLVTNNEREFRRIERLKVENWA